MVSREQFSSLIIVLRIYCLVVVYWVKVLKRLSLNLYLKLLVEDGVSALEAKFIPTLKNRQVADFYDRLGFSVMRVEEGVKYYMANIDKLDLSIPDYYSITVKQ